MENNKLRQSTRNVAVNIAAKMIMMLLPFVSRSIIIHTMGSLYLGVDSLFSSILSMLSLSELGFSSAIVFSMYKPVAEGDDAKVRALLTFFKRIYFVVGCIILGVGLLLLPNINMFIAEGTEYPTDINIYVVYLIFLVNTAASYFLFAYKNSILVATMRNDLNALYDLIRSLASHGLQVVALLAFRNYYLYIIVLPVITIANNLYRCYTIDKRFPQYKGKEKLDAASKKDIMTRVGALIGSKIGGVVFTSVDSIVISSFLGLVILGQYTNYYTIFNSVYAVLSTAYTAIQSTIGNSLVCKDREENYKLFRKLYSGNAVLTCFCTCCFVFLYQPFMRVWVGEENLLPIVIPLLLAVYYFVKGNRRICFVFKEAAGMWRETWLMPYLSVVLNLGLNILSVQVIGLPGVILSSIFALLVVEIPWETAVFFKKYFQKGVGSYVRQILISVIQTVLAVVITGLLSYGAGMFIKNDILTLVVRLVFCIAATGLTCFPRLKGLNLRKIRSALNRR